MDDKEVLMQEIWNHWEPYNEGGSGKWRSYRLDNAAKDTLEVDADCVTLVQSDNGLYVA